MIEIEGGGFESYALTLDRFRQHLDDFEPVWERVQKFLMHEHRLAFDAQKQPGTSTRWAPLSKEYKAYKDRVRPGKKILHFDGDLRDSLTKPSLGIRIVEPRWMLFGSDISYAKYHLNGTANMPKRPPLIDAVRSRNFKRTLSLTAQRYIVEGTVEL